MKRTLLTLLGLLIPAVVFAAPTSTVVQNLFITDLKSSGSPCLNISSVGLVATSTCGAGGGSVSTSSGITANYYLPWSGVSGTVSGTSNLYNQTTGISIATTTNAGLLSVGSSSMAMVVTSGGNVGIGTTNPTENLSLSPSADADVRQEIVAGGTSRYAVLKLKSSYGTANEKLWDILSNGDTGTFQIRATNDVYNAASVAMTITRSGATAGNVGIGITAPTSQLSLGNTTLAGDSTTKNYLNITGTMPSTLTAGFYGVRNVITTAGTSAQNVLAFSSELLAGYTGSNTTYAGNFENAVAGTGNTYINDTLGYRPVLNQGLQSYSHAVTTGSNAGGLYFASGGNTNYGIWSSATVPKNSAINVGIVGVGLNTSSSPTQVGGYFGLNASTNAPTFESSALIADNGTQTSPIFLARDNGTSVFGIYDGGNVVVGSSTAATLFSVATSTNIFNVLSNGNVGVGTTSPGYALSVAGSGAFTGYTAAPSYTTSGIYLQASGNNPSFLLSRSTNTANKRMWDVGMTSDGVFSLRAVNDAYSDATPWLSATGGYGAITSVTFPQGNVGIGTTAPKNLLDILTSSGILNFGGNGPNIGSNTYNDGTWRYSNGLPVSLIGMNDNGNAGDLTFYTAPAGTTGTAITFTNPMSIFNSGAVSNTLVLKGGNVGIGTSQPSSTLHVVGNGIFTTNLDVRGIASSTELRSPSSTIGTLNVTTCNGCPAGGSGTVSTSSLLGTTFPNGLGIFVSNTSLLAATTSLRFSTGTPAVLDVAGRVSSTDLIAGSSTLNGIATINEARIASSTTSGETTANTMDVSGALNASSTLTTEGNTALRGTLQVTGAVGASSTLDVQGNMTARGTLNVTGAQNNSSTLVVQSTGEIRGAATLKSTLDVAGAVNNSSTLTNQGNAVLRGTLDVTGAQNNSSTLTVQAGTSLRSTLTQSGGVASLASTTINGNATTTSLTIGSLAGVLKGTSGVVGTAANGTDFTLISANTCGAGQHVSAVSATGTVTCSVDTTSSTIPSLPVSIANGGIGTSTVFKADQLYYSNGTTIQPAVLAAGTNMTLTSSTTGGVTTYSFASTASGGGATNGHLLDASNVSLPESGNAFVGRSTTTESGANAPSAGFAFNYLGFVSSTPTSTALWGPFTISSGTISIEVTQTTSTATATTTAAVWLIDVATSTPNSSTTISGLTWAQCGTVINMSYVTTTPNIHRNYSRNCPDTTSTDPLMVYLSIQRAVEPTGSGAAPEVDLLKAYAY